MSRYMMFILFSIAAILIACSSGLGDMISLQLVERTAKETTRYCYTKDNQDIFCMTYEGKEE